MPVYVCRIITRLRQLLKLEPIELEEDEYAVQCEEEYFCGGI